MGRRQQVLTCAFEVVYVPLPPEKVAGWYAGMRLLAELIRDADPALFEDSQGDSSVGDVLSISSERR